MSYIGKYSDPEGILTLTYSGERVRDGQGDFIESYELHSMLIFGEPVDPTILPPAVQTRLLDLGEHAAGWVAE